MEKFNININLECDADDMSGSWYEVHGDDVTTENIKNEISSWLMDLGFSVSFGNQSSNKIIQDAKEFITDEDIKEVMSSENSTEFDVGYYKGLLDYESKCQSILWEYISEKDFEEIQERLNNE